MSDTGQAPIPPSVSADAVIIGGGIVGLATAVALADRDVSVALVTADRPGAAARAAAGLLVPHYAGEKTAGPASRFMVAGRDMYPSYIRSIEERSRSRIPFHAAGAIELASSPAEFDALVRAAPADALVLGREELARAEPAVAPGSGGLLYPRDGAVDNAGLTDALAVIASGHRRIRTVRDVASRLDLHGDAATVHGAAGARVVAARVVLAAGAWSGRLAGLPRPVPVRPIRGQLCTVRGAPLRHVVLAREVYMVTRGGDRTLIGSTMEEVGFEVGTTYEAIDAMRRAAASVCPALDGVPVLDAWSGLRPATPDLLPILGPDPEYPTLIYACGHSRNGILLAPITGVVTCAAMLGEPSPWDLAPFTIERFDPSATEGNQPPRH